MKSSTRAIAYALLILMMIPLFVFSASAKTVTVTAASINAVRGGGELVIYTPEMGNTTGTNEWGYEVIIEDNKAVKFNKGNSTIPQNGFVLSGHDEGEGGKNMGTWIKENIEIGDYVYYTPDRVVTVSDEPIAENVFYSLTQPIVGVNVTRELDSIAIYNKRGTLTGTNEWGYEIICENGIVVAMGGNNNTVPDVPYSCVVSGHGASVTWLQNNVKLGMSVSYDSVKKTVTFAYDETAVLSGMDIKLKDIRANYDKAITNYDYFDYAAAKAAIDALETEIATAKSDYNKSKDAGKLVEASNTIDAKFFDISLLLSESRSVEFRGVWIRPTDTSAAKVDETVQKLYDQGINTICIETLYDCTMIMPMPEGSLFETNPKFRKFDLLQAYIDSCHKRDMELHLWMPIYYVGDSGSSNLKYSLGKKKPEWLSVSNTGKYSHQVSEPGVEGAGLMMLDPSNEEASNYLLGTYKYILETYDVDGFQLDYIRYYNRGSDYDMGYTKEALDAFEAKYGVRPQYNIKADYWNDWVDFRCDYISTFVQRVRKLIDETRPGVLLGADVVPDPTESVSVNYQDYYTWLENKWIDVLFPMSYGYGHEEAIAEQTERCGENSFIAVGLGIFMAEMNPSDMHVQSVYNSSVYADGSVHFEASAYLKKNTGEYLLKGVYRNKAITPTLDLEKAAKAQLEFMRGRISDIIVPMNGMSKDNATEIIGAIDELLQTVTKDGFDAQKYNAVKTAVSESDANDAAKTRMLSDLSIALKGFTVMNKELDMSGVPETPDAPNNQTSQDVSEEASSENSTVEDVSSDENQGGIGSDIIIVIICAVVVIGAAIAAVIILKKKGNK